MRIKGYTASDKSPRPPRRLNRIRVLHVLLATAAIVVAAVVHADERPTGSSGIVLSGYRLDDQKRETGEFIIGGPGLEEGKFVGGPQPILVGDSRLVVAYAPDSAQPMKERFYVDGHGRRYSYDEYKRIWLAAERDYNMTIHGMDARSFKLRTEMVRCDYLWGTDTFFHHANHRPLNIVVQDTITGNTTTLKDCLTEHEKEEAYEIYAHKYDLPGIAGRAGGHRENPYYLEALINADAEVLALFQKRLDEEGRGHLVAMRVMDGAITTDRVVPYLVLIALAAALLGVVAAWLRRRGKKPDERDKSDVLASQNPRAWLGDTCRYCGKELPQGATSCPVCAGPVGPEDQAPWRPAKTPGREG